MQESEKYAKEYLKDHGIRNAIIACVILVATYFIK